jgi:O-acetyl-ADP-ribose deacetylase (regulator of RNase III)
VDVIVNAANEDLQHGGGVAGHISQCAGSSLQQECRRYIEEHGKLPTGNAMYTKAGRLSSVKYVVHAVGPRWPHQTRDSISLRKVESDLANAVKSSLELADQLKSKTVAFPAISSGIYGCPADFVAKHIIQTTSNYMTENLSTSLTEVHVVLLEKETDKIRCFQERMKRDLDPIAKPRTKASSKVIQATNTVDTVKDTIPIVRRSEMHPRPINWPFKVVVKRGDLSTEDSDVIVNSTNNRLDMSSAMASSVLSKKAGPNLQDECSDYVDDNGALPSGGIYTSGGHNLPCQYVVHVNCPNTEQGLAKAVEDCLSEARGLNAQSVAIPALCTGRMGMSDAVAAKAMFDGIDKFSSTGNSSILEVSVMIFDAPRFPVFQLEQARRSGIDVDDGHGEAMMPLSDSIQLSNGTIVSLKQGDVTADSSDVIVAPTGVVLSAVAKKSQQTHSDFSTQYIRTPFDVADLSAGGQLLCRRVYVISVPPRSLGISDDQCILTIQNIIEKCLTMADKSKYSSIAIPAIGTGGLGYSNRHAAAAVIEAAKSFAVKSRSPSLLHIKIAVFEGHRISDFQQELQGRATARKGGFFQTVATRILNFFSGDEENAKPKRKRKILENFAAGTPDIASVAVIATNRSVCQKAHSMLQKAVKDACKDTDVDIEMIPEGFDTNELKTIAAKFGVSLKFQVKPDKEGKGKITLQGFKEDVSEVKSTILMLLNKALVDEADAANKERILERGRWLWEEDDGTFKQYSDEQTVRIETARERGESIVKISLNGVEYDVDIAKQIQTAPGRRARKIRRENKFQVECKKYMASTCTVVTCALYQARYPTACKLD